MQTTKTPLVFALIFTGAILIGFYLTSRINLAFSSDLETFSGPRAYPGMVLGAMLAFNLLSVFQIRRRKLLEAQEPKLRIRQAMALFAVLVLFCFLLEPFGYILTMIPLLIVAARLNGATNWPATIIVSIMLAVICLVIFRYALDTVLPEGLLGIDGIF